MRGAERQNDKDGKMTCDVTIQVEGPLVIMHDEVSQSRKHNMLRVQFLSQKYIFTGLTQIDSFGHIFTDLTQIGSFWTF